MIDVSKLDRWRRPELERMIFGTLNPPPGNIAGDIVLGSKKVAVSIRFSFEQDDPEFPGGTWCLLSTENHRSTDAEVSRFMAFARLKILTEVAHPVLRTARRFTVAPER